MRVWVFLLVLLLGASDGPADDGRRGNALFERGAYADAEAAYRKGLRALTDTTDALYARLQNNLGAALHRQEKFAAAQQAFLRAARTAPDGDLHVRAWYNAGNAAAGAGQLQAALNRYRTALRHDPTYSAARFNYEVLKREMARRIEQRRGDRPPPVDPSPFAKRLKRQAEALAARQQYAAAHRLLENGRAQDSTVAAFQTFMTRLKDVATINQGPVPQGPGQSLRSGSDSSSGSP